MGAQAEQPAPIVLAKLGGSLITEKSKPGTLRTEVLERLAEEIARARPRLASRLVVGHGSGSFGHRAALDVGFEPGRPPPPEGVAQVQRAARHLHRLVLEGLDAAGLPAFSLSPAGFLMTEEGRQRLCFLDPLLGALDRELLPVVHGDVVLDREWGAAIASTETVFLAVARRLRRRKLPLAGVIWAGETPGVLDSEGSTIQRLDPEAARQMSGRLAGASGPDVTGGIAHRLETVARLARMGVPSTLIDGRRPGELARALSGQPVDGTRVAP